MNYSRAKEIFASPIMVDVTYNDTQIYIDSVNETTQTAHIHYLNQPSNKLEVPVSNLQEN